MADVVALVALVGGVALAEDGVGSAGGSEVMGRVGVVATGAFADPFANWVVEAGVAFAGAFAGFAGVALALFAAAFAGLPGAASAVGSAGFGDAAFSGSVIGSPLVGAFSTPNARRVPQASSST